MKFQQFTMASLMSLGLWAGATFVAPSPTHAAGTYTVQPGDWLSKIADRFGQTWETLHAANPAITNPHLIFPGQVLTIPGGDIRPASQPIAATQAPPPPPPPPAPVQPSGPHAWDGLLQQHFGAAWTTAKRILICESGGNPLAMNTRPPDYSVGLFQINLYGGNAANRPSEGWLKVGANNIAYAAQMYRNAGYSFRDWTCQ